jgi:hypothetical protein
MKAGIDDTIVYGWVALTTAMFVLVRANNDSCCIVTFVMAVVFVIIGCPRNVGGIFVLDHGIRIAIVGMTMVIMQLGGYGIE